MRVNKSLTKDSGFHKTFKELKHLRSLYLEELESFRSEKLLMKRLKTAEGGFEDCETWFRKNLEQKIILKNEYFSLLSFENYSEQSEEYNKSEPQTSPFSIVDCDKMPNNKKANSKLRGLLNRIKDKEISLKKSNLKNNDEKIIERLKKIKILKRNEEEKENNKENLILSKRFKNFNQIFERKNTVENHRERVVFKDLGCLGNIRSESLD